MKTLSFPIRFGAILLGSQAIAFADPLDNWTLRNPGPTPNNFRAVASGNSQVVAVGTVGTIATSSDGGDTWVLRNSGITNLLVNLSSVTFGNNRFVAVPEPGGFQNIVTSTNGTNWSLTPVAFSNNWFFTAIAFGGGNYTMVGYSGGTNVILTSPDASTWTRRFCGVGDAFTAITYAQSQFVAVGGTQFPTNRSFIVTSPDGITWTTRRTNVPAYYTSVAGNASGYVAVGTHTTSRSATGTTWTDVTDSNVAVRNAVAAGPNLFVSSDVYYTGQNDSSTLYNSTDGSAWTNAWSPAQGVNAITYANGRYVAVGTTLDPGVSALGTRPSIFVSPDGTNWTSRTRSMQSYTGSRSSSVSGIAYEAGKFVAITLNTIDMGTAFTSTNGLAWSGSPYGSMLPSPPGEIVFANGKFVAVGGEDSSDSGATSYSTDGTNWTQNYSPAPGSLKAVAYGGGLYVAVGRMSSGNRPVLTSADGANWSPQTSFANLTNDLLAITFGGGKFVAVGAAGAVATTTDGSTWTQQSIVSSNHLRSVLFTNSQFVAVGDAGTIFTSPDGAAWTRRTSNTTRDLNAIVYFDNHYLAAGDYGTLLSSTDAISWTATDSGTDANLTSAGVGAGMLVLGGENNLIESSTNVLVWSASTLGGAASEMLFRSVLSVDDRVMAFASPNQAKSTTGRTWSQLAGNTYTAGNSALLTNGVLVTAGTEELGQPTRISYSLDRGDSWTDLSFGSLGQLYGLTHGNGMFVTCGDHPGGTNAPILTSTNGINWTYRLSGMPATLWDIAYGNGLFVAVGPSGGVRSSDGITWVTNAAAIGETVAFGGGKFVAAGSSILLSTNGTNWSTVLTGVTIENVRYGFGTFIAVGPSGSVLTSTNGSNWVTRFVRTRQNLNAVNFANDSAFIVGFGGTIYQSDYLASTPATILRNPQNTTALAGNTATFQVSVTGRLPMTFQWFKNGVPISGATDSTLSLTSVTNSDAGSYHVVVRNDFGSQVSGAATLTVLSPSVGVSPESLYLFTNTAGAFTATVSGGTPVGYQWRKYFSPISGATNATLVFTNAQIANQGDYSVTVTFAAGSLLSTNTGTLMVLSSLDEVTLSVNPGYLQTPTGSTAVLAANVLGPTPLSYQWRKNGTNISGATLATLTLTNLALSASGDYTYYVTYNTGSVTNEFYPCTLDVYYAEPPVITGSRLIGANQFQFNFTGLTNRYYQIDYATNLTAPVEWRYLDTVQLITNPHNYQLTYPILDAPNKAFIRLQILPP